MTNHLQQILNYFRNLTLNSIGVTRSLQELLDDKDVAKALTLFNERDDEVDQAVKEYNPQTHDVMKRPNKYRKKSAPYITEKLPRSRQKYINNVEVFFLLANPVEWKKVKGDDEAYTMFTDFLKEQHFNARMRQAKRLAGAETESAKLYHMYRDKDGATQVKSLVLARSTGYRLRPLIDQYGTMVAFAYGYKLKENSKTVEHWDIQTPEMLYYCTRKSLGWDVSMYPNPTGKINVIYYRQEKAWEGVEPRIHREEMLDSKTADTNNYFGDPMAAATADVIDALADPDKPGKLIQLTGNNSRFEYINPPQSPEIRRAEKDDLKESILFDTYTPDFDFEKLRGMGTLSGTAIRNSFILGYIKRDNLKEIYEEMLTREKNVIIAILKFLHPEKARILDELEVEGSFSEPFADDKQAQWSAICQLYTAGLVSLEEAVHQLAICDAPEAEIERIKQAKQEALEQQQQMQAAKTGQQAVAATGSAVRPEREDAGQEPQEGANEDRTAPAV